MEVKIGVQHAPRELSIDTDLDAAGVEKAVTDALASTDGVLSLKDVKGRLVVVPAGRVAYVEIATTATGTVGFRS